MKDNKNIYASITYGVIIGLVYVLILLWRWTYATDFMKFGLITLISFIIVLCLMFFEAFQVRKLNNGFIDLKKLFRTLFISVLIFELFYAVYNFIHLKYIDPEIGNRMKEGMQEIFDKVGDKMSDADKEKALEKIGDVKRSTELPHVIKGYLSGVAMSGLFALIISAIVKKKKPVFEENI